MSKNNQNSQIILKRKPTGEKVLRGAFGYYKNDIEYGREDFEIWKDSKNLNLSCFSNFTSRVATGELLNVYVDLNIGFNYIPTMAYVEKSMGEDFSFESYSIDNKLNKLKYNFKSKYGSQESKINTAPKFFISTPSAAMSCLFIRSKKEDPSNKNVYSIVQSFNSWNFENDPSIKSIVLSRVGVGSKSINLMDKNLQVIEYKIMDYFEETSKSDQNHKNYITAFVSRYYNVPYLIKSTDGVKMQIKYLNNLEND